MKAAASARRVTLGNLLVRGMGCVVVLPFAAQVAGLLALLPIPAAKLPVDVHLAFNIVVALVMWPLSGPLSRLMERRQMAARPHGFRSSLRDWLAEATEAPHEVAETMLGHAVGGLVERAYRRTDFLDQRRALLERWAAHVTGNGEVP